MTAREREGAEFSSGGYGGGGDGDGNGSRSDEQWWWCRGRCGRNYYFYHAVLNSSWWFTERYHVTLRSISPAICGRACSRANRPCLRAARLTRCPRDRLRARGNRRQFLWHWVTKLRWHFQGVGVQRPRRHWCQCQQQRRLPTRIPPVKLCQAKSMNRNLNIGYGQSSSLGYIQLK